MPQIKKVAVLGSGIMGSRIACHFAGIGLPVLLLDMPATTPDSASGKVERNRLADNALQQAVQSNPSPVYLKDVVKHITTGNFEDDLHLISGLSLIHI